MKLTTCFRCGKESVCAAMSVQTGCYISGDSAEDSVDVCGKCAALWIGGLLERQIVVDGVQTCGHAGASQFRVWLAGKDV